MGLESGTHEFFATCPRGLELPLEQELQEWGASTTRCAQAGVAFTGALTTCMRANLHSRLASRILWQVGHGSYRTEHDLYQAAYRLPWPDWCQVNHSLRVDTHAWRSPLRSIDFVTLRVKDAICDRFRLTTGSRPSVDTHNPIHRIFVYLEGQNYQLYLDTSGAALFRRPHHRETGSASLKRNLAAGILRLSGWQPGVPLLDPFCGSGTMLVEAAEMALERAPGLGRSFGFEDLTGWDCGPWKQLCAEALQRQLPPRPLELWGHDLKGESVVQTQANLGAAGLDGCVQLKQINFLESSAPASHGWLVGNPPYGVRMGEQEELAAFYPCLGDTLKQRFANWEAWLLTADLRLAKLIRLTPARRIPLFNGALECRLFQFRLVPGSNRKSSGASHAPL